MEAMDWCKIVSYDDVNQSSSELEKTEHSLLSDVEPKCSCAILILWKKK